MKTDSGELYHIKINGKGLFYDIVICYWMHAQNCKQAFTKLQTFISVLNFMIINDIKKNPTPTVSYSWSV